MTSVHKRAYKACESCRRTKARCEIDSNATKCYKCTREHKECIFPAQRSTKRARTSPYEAEKLNEDVATRPRRAPRVATSTVQSSINEQPRNVQVDQRNGSESQQQSLNLSEDMNQDRPQNSYLGANLQNDVLQAFVTSSSDAIGLLFRAAEHNDSDGSEGQAAIDVQCLPEVQSEGYSMPSPAVASNETLSLWAQHRFVRQGWFTPREAISYVEFFFQNLSPLSLAADSFYADHRNHKRLILEEPLLCCTILMIASRFHDPVRGNGSRARADFVHNRLWRHIEHLIQRITFGSEKYSVGKTRTLGSIQALLLIVEWHPRALHFPPEIDGWDASLAPSIDDTYQAQQDASSEASRRWRQDVFEPAKRSDRMSWMLVGLGVTLAHELGVFDSAESNSYDSRGVNSNEAQSRIRRLLFVYAAQLSMRLGCSNVFPNGTHQDITFVPEQHPSIERQVIQDRELLVMKWIQITKLMATAYETLFANKTVTKQMIRGPRYINLLEHFRPLLNRWYDDFLKMSCPTVAEAARQILLVEFYFVKLYINSIAVQALVERADGNDLDDSWLIHDLLRPESSQDSRFVREVRDSSVEILRIATELSQKAILQYCPVRFFLRVVAASIYLLKTISLGSLEADVNKSLEQLDLCIKALQNNSGDDIHLSSRYATLIARHVRRFRRNFKVKRTSAFRSAASRAASRGPESTNVAGRMTVDDLHGPTVDLQKQRPADGNISSEQHGNRNGRSLATNDMNIPLDFDESDLTQEWLAQPFNFQFAPFGVDGIPPASGLAIDSLDFLWNITT